LPRIAPDNRVLGVIRPTTEVVGKFTRTGKIGILATGGTVMSGSYPIEIARFSPEATVFQQACPMWVPLVENSEHDKPGADFFVKENINQLLDQSQDIDTVLLACTHYPLMRDKIAKYLPQKCKLIVQGEIVAESLADYLIRHREIESRCSKNGQLRFYTTDSVEDFDAHASIFYGRPLHSEHIQIS
ncbi:MAG TPA: aspartate/glutamate racemase family protein, partial [Puia sp.]